jgi:hypothetical protein
MGEGQFGDWTTIMSIQRVVLSDGSTILIEAASATIEEEVASRNREATFGPALASVRTLCEELSASMRDAAPDRAIIEFGLSLTVETTGLSALIGKVGAQTNFKVTLEWLKQNASS